jgi:hypothetical protein
LVLNFLNISVYSNAEIPKTWKTKLSYQNDIMNIMSNDKPFLNYLIKVGPPSKENAIRPKSIKEGKLQSISHNLPILNQKNDEGDMENVKTNEKKNNQNNPNYTTPKNHLLNNPSYTQTNFRPLYAKNNDSLNFETVDITDLSKQRSSKFQKQMTINRFKSLSPQKVNTYTDKEKRQILEHYRKMYSHRKGQERECKEEHGMNKSSKENYPIEKTGNKAFEDMFNSTQKSQMFKSSIYSLLVPTRNKTQQGSTYYTSNENPMQNTMQSKGTKNHDTVISKSSNTHYGPFLNSTYNEYNKKIEIRNPEIKKCLEDINYYGPYFSHCPSCKNKNLNFYQTLEPHQCLKLLNFIKKERSSVWKIKKKPKEKDQKTEDLSDLEELSG